MATLCVGGMGGFIAWCRAAGLVLKDYQKRYARCATIKKEALAGVAPGEHPRSSASWDVPRGIAAITTDGEYRSVRNQRVANRFNPLLRWHVKHGEVVGELPVTKAPPPLQRAGLIKLRLPENAFNLLKQPFQPCECPIEGENNYQN